MTDNAAMLAIATPQIKRDEGCELTAYPDPLSGADPWTIGYGHTGEDVCEGTVWTQEQADVALQADLANAVSDLTAALPWFADLDPVRQAVLANMCFNMGIRGLLLFRQTLAAVQAGDWATASSRMLLSRWATQVGDRADRLAAQMRTGEV